MRTKFIVLVLLLSCDFLVAQQAGDENKPTDDCGNNPWASQYGSCVNAYLHRLKEFYDKQAAERDKALQENIEKAQQAAEEAKKIHQNVVDLGSTDTKTQIDGLTHSVQDLNSHANGNEASKPVTNKSLDVIGRVGKREVQLLNQVNTDVQSVSGTQGGSLSSSFNSNDQHVLVEHAPLNVENRVDARARVLLSSPQATEALSLQPSANPTTTKRVTVEDEVSSRAQQLLASPSAVGSMAAKQREINAAIEEERKQQAREEAERKAALEAQKLAEQRRVDAEYAREQRQEEREQRQAEARQQAFLKALYGEPYSPTNTAPQVPAYYPPPVQPYSNSFGGYSPSYSAGSASTTYSGSAGHGFTRWDISKCQDMPMGAAQTDCIWHSPLKDESGNDVPGTMADPNGEIGSSPTGQGSATQSSQTSTVAPVATSSSSGTPTSGP